MYCVSCRVPQSNTTLDYVGFVVDKVVPGEVLLSAIVIITPPTTDRFLHKPHISNRKEN
jgi:hypothetical protein